MPKGFKERSSWSTRHKTYSHCHLVTIDSWTSGIGDAVRPSRRNLTSRRTVVTINAMPVCESLSRFSVFLCPSLHSLHVCFSPLADLCAFYRHEGAGTLAWQSRPARLHMFQPSIITRGGCVIPGSPTTLSNLRISSHQVGEERRKRKGEASAKKR